MLADVGIGDGRASKGVSGDGVGEFEERVEVSESEEVVTMSEGEEVSVVSMSEDEVMDDVSSDDHVFGNLGVM